LPLSSFGLLTCSCQVWRREIQVQGLMRPHRSTDSAVNVRTFTRLDETHLRVFVLRLLRCYVVEVLTKGIVRTSRIHSVFKMLVSDHGVELKICYSPISTLTKFFTPRDRFHGEVRHEVVELIIVVCDENNVVCLCSLSQGWFNRRGVVHRLAWGRLPLKSPPR